MAAFHTSDRASAIKANIPLSTVASNYTELSRAGRELRGRCPFHNDNTPSFYVNDEKGTFHCFGCQAGGDVIDFIQRIENMNFTDACDLLEGNSNIAIRKVPNPAQPNSKAEDARRIWNAATSIVGTPADVYLARRGIPLSRIALQPNLRFAKLKFDGSEALHPALVAAVRDVRGEITGIQRTYLTEEGEKLCVDAKRSLGTIRGGAIRLSSGGDEDDLGAIYLCEGLEDGLSLLRLQGDAPVWVAAGAGMMEAVKLPATTTNVRIVPDNDFAGRSAALRAGVKFTKQGVFVHLNRLPDEFKDYNEFLLHHLASPVSPEADPGEESGA